MSEVYDTGSKEVKLIGDKSEQLKPLVSLPVSALFMGAQSPILYDETVKRKFKDEFNSKLARRSFFCFVPEEVPDIDYPTVDAMIKAEQAIEDQALEARKIVDEGVSAITEQSLQQTGQLLPVSPEVRRLFLTYRRYNKEVAKTMSKAFQLSILVRTHLQWKALKLSGALALFNQHEQIEQSDYIQAINFCEILDKDMALFEAEFVKGKHELFCSFMHAKAVDHQATISLHVLQKMGFISGQITKAKLTELIQLSNSFDNDGTYKLCDDGICFERIQREAVPHISFVPVSGSKETRAKQCSQNFTYAETTFPELAKLLAGDYAYTPFQFLDGKRSKANITGSIKWIVLDIDNSTITASECHEILKDTNHHIALTSDPDNDFKFRILIELDANVTITQQAWRYFTQYISEALSITADILPQSQIYFSYANRPIYSVIDADPLETKDFLLLAESAALDKPKKPKPTTKAEAKALLDDPMGTFEQAYQASHGEGSRKLIWAAYKAHELGMSHEDIITLMHDINNYWLHPMPEPRFTNTILSIVNRL